MPRIAWRFGLCGLHSTVESTGDKVLDERVLISEICILDEF